MTHSSAQSCTVAYSLIHITPGVPSFVAAPFRVTFLVFFMRPSVATAFARFNQFIEGHLPCMYLDVEGHVTTGIGNPLFSIEQALALPWERVHFFTAAPAHLAEQIADKSLTSPSLTRATEEEIRLEWDAVVGARGSIDPQSPNWAIRAQLILPMQAVETLALERAQECGRRLEDEFPNWAQWPADAQLATLSMAWAMTQPFCLPRWESAVRHHDWSAAALNCKIEADQIDPRGKRSTVDQRFLLRNLINRALFVSARLGQRQDPEVLHFTDWGK